MTKEEALAKTREKFTNLFGGDILPGVSVGKIISYYESLIADKKPSYKAPVSGIEANFMEDEMNEFRDLYIDDYYDGLGH